jgi:hypothetical protein
LISSEMMLESRPSRPREMKRKQRPVMRDTWSVSSNLSRKIGSLGRLPVRKTSREERRVGPGADLYGTKKWQKREETKRVLRPAMGFCACKQGQPKRTDCLSKTSKKGIGNESREETASTAATVRESIKRVAR